MTVTFIALGMLSVLLVVVSILLDRDDRRTLALRMDAVRRTAEPIEAPRTQGAWASDSTR